jgi:hypothetical protein
VSGGSYSLARGLFRQRGTGDRAGAGSITRSSLSECRIAATTLSIEIDSWIGVGKRFNKSAIAIHATRTRRFLRVGKGTIVKWIKAASAGGSPLVPRIAPVACLSCGRAAHLIRRAPLAQLGVGIEQRTFECSACLERTAITVEHELSA